MITFDHIAVSGETLADAQTFVEDALGVRMQPGGKHDVFFTHNALLGLEDGLYFEAIAIDPDAERPAKPRWFDLDSFSGTPRLTNWICRTDDVAAALKKLPAGMGVPVDLKRGDLQWSMVVPENGVLPYENCAPALIKWKTPTHPASMLEASGVRLRRLTIRHPRADEMAALLAPVLQDDRVGFDVGAAGLHASFDTPNGLREIGA
ncbi:MAG: VOC family protein [Roseobacter sp.]